MRLYQQRNTLRNGILDASIDLKYMRSAILRKMAAPYGDGSRSNMVNAETDVLPRIDDILDTLAAVLESADCDPEADAIRAIRAVRADRIC